MASFSIASAVLWELKLAGDVVEDSETGNATSVLWERICKRCQEFGLDIDVLTTTDSFQTAVWQAERDAKLIVSKRSTKRYAIRLNLEDLPANPFVHGVVYKVRQRKGQELAPVSAPPVKKPRTKTEPISETIIENSQDLLGDIAGWSLSKRMTLSAQLNESINRDFQQYRAAVLEGL